MDSPSSMTTSVDFNITETYVEKDNPWLGIVSATTVVIISTTKRLKYYSLGQLVFGCDTILSINHKVDWQLIHQKNQTQFIKIINAKI